MRLTDNAEKVLTARYYQKNEKGEIAENWNGLCRRVCNAVAKAEENGAEEKWANNFFDMMHNLDFLPNSPTMFNAGREKGLLSACFTLDVEDNMQSIMKAVSDAAMIFKMGGGVGLSFSSLRPEGELIKSTGGTSCLTGDTVLYNLNPKKPSIKQSITIDQLYKIKMGNKSYPQMIKCMVDDGVLGTNRIIDVIYNGKAVVYEVKTKNGYSIKATKNHRFLDEDLKWKTLNLFYVGDLISINGKQREVKICERCARELPVRGKNSKYKGLCENCVVSVFHGYPLTGSEENLSNIKLRSEKHKEYLNLPEVKAHLSKNNSRELNPMWKGECAKENTARARARQWYPDLNLSKCTRCDETENIQIHHKDVNPYNNSIDNLEIVCDHCHGHIHQVLRYKDNPRLMKVIDTDEIISITELPEADVYDIAMAAPYHNFVANGFISHNSGPVSFMRMFDTMTEVVKQGGKRRGALLGLLDIDHKDVGKFISCKTEEGVLSNFNVSIGISDDFMYKVKSKDATSIGLWNKIVNGAWGNGEPGILFMTAINAGNPVPHMGKIKSSNPCGEFLFIPYGSCNLGSINLANMVKEGDINWEKLDKTVRTAVRFLDDVISVNWYPLPEIKDITLRTRPIGLGIMGFADLLIKLEVRYDSSEGIDYATEIMEFINSKAYDESSKLGKEKGNFPEFKKTKFPEKYEYLRNCQLTVIAPTGSLSLLAGVSSGIEPNFAWSTEMHRIDTIMEETHPLASKFLRAKEVLPNYFVTAADISPEWHIRMQAAFQTYTDSAISKCVAKGTLINTDKGVIPIEQIGLFGDRVGFTKPVTDIYVYDKNKKLSKVTNLYYGGNQSTKILRFNNGQIIECSINHKFLTPKGWKRCEELSINDYIECTDIIIDNPIGEQEISLLDLDIKDYGNSKRFELPQKMRPKLAQWLGMLCADGSTNLSSGAVVLTCANKIVKQTYIRLCENLFGIAPKVLKDKRTFNTEALVFNSRNLVRYVESLIGKGCRDKKVPLQVMIGNREEQLAFLAGVTLDGYIKTNGSRKELCVYEGYSKKLAEQIASLCSFVGLRPYQGNKLSSTNEQVYNVIVDDTLIQPIELHKDIVLHRKEYVVKIPEVKNSTIKAPWWKKRNLNKIVNAGNTIVRQHLLDDMGISYDNSEFYVKITDITDSSNELYDIEVEGSHSYTIGNIISHNTVNMPNSATKEDVAKAYMLAWELKCKGVTIYREGSRTKEVLVKAGSKKPANHKMLNLIYRERGNDLKGTTRKAKTGCGNSYITVNYDDSGYPIEVFKQVSTKGGCDAMSEGLARMVSMALRYGIDMTEIVRQLRSVKCANAIAKNVGCLSCPDLMGRVLIDLTTKKEAENQEVKCPECGAQLATLEGCIKCQICGYSKCG